MRKNIFFTAVCMLFIFCAQSQEKYEFAILEYSTYDGLLSISKDGLEFSKEKTEAASGYNANPLLTKIKDWQEKDWEVMQFNTVLAGREGNKNNEIYFAYMRRKKK